MRIGAVATKDIILTLGVMLVAGLVCQVVADTLRVPRMLVLLLGGTLLGPSVTGAIDVPLDSTGAELLLTLGRVVHPVLRRAAALASGC